MSFVGVATFLGLDVATAAGLAGVDIAAADVGAGLIGADAAGLGAAGLGTAGLTGLADAGVGFGAAADAAALDAGATGLASGIGGVGTLGGLAGTGADLASTIGSFLGAGTATAGSGFGALADTAAADAAATGLASGTSSIAGGLSNAFPTDLASLALQPTSLPGEATTGVQPSTFGGSTGAVPASTAAPTVPSPASVAPAGPSAATASAPAGVSSPFGTPDVTSPTATIPGGTAGTPAAPVSPTASLTTPQSPGLASLTGANPNESIPGAAGYTSVGGAPLTGGATDTGSNIFGSLGDKALGAVTNNPLGTALGAAGLGYSIYNGQKLTANQNALTNIAQGAAQAGEGAIAQGQQIAGTNATTGQGLVASGEALQQYLTSGTLPPEYMAQVTQAINDAKTKAINNAVAAGQPGDPSKNSSLAASLAAIDNQQPQLIANLAQTLFTAGSTNISAGTGATANSASSLLSSGAQATGLSGQLYSTLVQNDTAQAANTGKAIANLAAALNGKSPGTSVGSLTISQNG